MRIKFLGSGSAFVRETENYQSNILINDSLLYDCGTTINEALHTNNIKIENIKAIFISHLHADHIGGLEYIGFSSYFVLNKYRINLLIPRFLYKNVKEYLNITMSNTPDGIQAVEGYFNPILIEKKYNNLQIIETEHTKERSYGIIIDNIFISGDTIFNKGYLVNIYNSVEHIFHDCEFANYPNSVHTQFRELKTLSEDIKSKMYLYHYSLGDKTYLELEKEVLDAGFKGLVKRGEEFELG